MALAHITSDGEWATVCCTIWAIWRCRNDHAYSAKEASFLKFSSYLSVVMTESKIREGGALKLRNGIDLGQNVEIEQQMEYTCQVDGSWISNWDRGIGLVAMKVDTLLATKSKGVHVYCPIQAEALALSEAVQYIKSYGIKECCFQTDNQEIALAIEASQPPVKVDW